MRNRTKKVRAGDVRPLSWVDPVKVARRLVEIVARKGMTNEVCERARSTKGGQVTLPSFSVFSQDAYAPAHTWTVPKFRGDYLDFEILWEGFINQRPDPALKTDWRPAVRPVDPLKMLQEWPVRLLSRAQISSYFGDHASAGSWPILALKLAAVSQQYEGQLDLNWKGRSLQRVRGYMYGNRLIDVSLQGCWSNDEARLVLPQGVAPGGIGLPMGSVSVARRSSTDPQAIALMHLVEDGKLPDSAAWMANFLLGQRHPLPWPSGRSVYKPRSSVLKSTPSAQADAAYSAVVLLQEGRPDVLPRLEQIIVPALCSRKNFARFFGDPRSSREVKPHTQAAWMNKVIALSEGVDLAEAR